MWRWFTVELSIRTLMARCSRDNTCKSAMLISRSVTWSRFRYFRPLLAVWMEYPIYRRMWLILFNNNIIHIYMLRWLFISVDGIMHYRVWYKFSVLLASWSTCFSTFNWLTQWFNTDLHDRISQSRKFALILFFWRPCGPLENTPRAKVGPRARVCGPLC